VCRVVTAIIGTLLDHFVRLEEEQGENGDAQALVVCRCDDHSNRMDCPAGRRDGALKGVRKANVRWITIGTASGAASLPCTLLQICR
jgi:hypothetical protein